MIWSLPDNWNISQAGFPVYQGYSAGDSLIVSFTLSIPDTNNLPFYPQYIELNLLTNRQNSMYQTITMAGKVYFTPYNSIEIWNLEDFYDLKRNWLEEDSIPPQRIFIPREDIPVSNLGDDPSIYERDSATWNDWWIDNFREVEIEGLAYTVLMTPVPYDSLDYYANIGDMDTTDNDGPVQKKLGKTFTGTIKGRVTSTVKTGEDNETNVVIGLAGLRINLYDDDLMFDDYIGSTYTDEDGYYTINYSTDQGILEGKNIELFVKLYSETNNSYQIQSKNTWSIYNHKKNIGTYGQNAGTIVQNLDISGSTGANVYTQI
jgi:hypothetical protein